MSHGRRIVDEMGRDFSTLGRLIHEFLDDPEKAADTHLGDGAVIVSAGDRPLVSIACSTCEGARELTRKDGSTVPCPVCARKELPCR